MDQRREREPDTWKELRTAFQQVGACHSGRWRTQGMCAHARVPAAKHTVRTAPVRSRRISAQVAADFSAKPPIISPTAAIQLPQTRNAIAFQSPRGPNSARLNAIVRAITSVIAT